MAQNPFPFGSIDYDNWNYEHPADAAQQADPIADAKLSLAKSDALEMNRDLPDASTRASVQALMPQFDQLEKKYAGGPHSLLRGTTEGVANLALPLAGASLVAPPAGLLSMAAAAPDFLRRTIAPEADESRPGGVETALTALPVALPALRGLKSLAAERSLAPVADMLGGKARAFEGAAQPMRPWPAPQGFTAAEEAAPSAIEQLIESPSFRNLPKGNVSKAAKPTLSPFKQMQAEGAFAGDRSVRGIGGLEQEGPGGLSSLKSLKKNALPLGKTLDIPTSEPLDPMEKLAARSAERFGRRFRKE